MIDFNKMTKKQKQIIYDDWYAHWKNHDCDLVPSAEESSCEFCHRFWTLCYKLNIKPPFGGHDEV